MASPASFVDDEPLGIDMDSYTMQVDKQDDEALKANSIDMDAYSGSREEEKATWFDWAKDVFIQPLSGAAKRFTWPLDVLKLGMVGDALSGLDEFEAAAEREGIPFDRDRYIKAVMDQGEFIPTQDFLEQKLSGLTGVDLKPKTKTGKALNKFFTLAGLTRGSLGKKALAGGTGSATTETLKAADQPEWVSEIAGDVTGGLSTAFERTSRLFSPKAEKIKQTADKYGLPFLEYMAEEEAGFVTPKITKAQDEALKKQISMSADEAVKQIVEGKLNAAQLRQKGVNLDIIEQEAYANALQAAQANPSKISTSDIVADIDSEISRIKGLAPSPSDADKAAISILENEKKNLTTASKNTRLPKEVSSENLINQYQNYNKNVKNIYKKPQYSGNENAVKGAYAFLNQSIVKAMDRQGASDVSSAFRAANKVFAENATLKNTENLLFKAYKDDFLDPKKLKTILTSKQGLKLREYLGKDGVKNLYDIADYGTKAINATSQFGKSSKAFDMTNWGVLAPMLLGGNKILSGSLAFAKPIAQHVKGQMLLRPATREVYKGILKNAAKGSFKNMAADFSRLEKAVTNYFGSPEQLIKNAVDELEIYRGED